MSILMTILLLIAISVFLLLIGLGLAIALGVLFIGGIFLAIAFFIFGNGPVWSGIGVSNQAKALPQHFNQCLLGEDLELCRTKYTMWKKEEAETIRQLSKQVKEELGPRLEDDTKSSQYAQSTINGNTTVTMDEETNFTKKKSVREHYVFIVDPSDKTLKIKELNWDYGLESSDAPTPDP